MPLSFAPLALGTSGLAYGAAAATVGAYLLWLAAQIVRTKSDRAARRMFGFSILYLFVLFAALIVEHVAI